MAKYKIGDRFKFMGAERHIIGVHETDASVRYWVHFLYADPGKEYDSVREEYITDTYVKIKPFFEVGKTYRFHKNGCQYRVEEVKEVKGNKFAWALDLDHDQMTTLDSGEFGEMTEV